METGRRRETPLNPRHTVDLSVVWDEDESGTRVGIEAFYTGRQALVDDPYRSRSRPYVVVDALAEQKVGAARLFVNVEDLGDMHQTRFEPILRSSAGPGGRWTMDAWAPLVGRVINVGVRLNL